MKVTTAAIRDVSSPIFQKESNTNKILNKKINSSKLNSNNLIASVSMASNKTSVTNTNNNCIILKPKAKNISGNSFTNVYLMPNPNEKEKTSISIVENNNSSEYNNNNILPSSKFGSNKNISKFAADANNNNVIKDNQDKVKMKTNASSIQLSNIKCRRDARGTPILKGRKKHRIAFRDYLDGNGKLFEVFKIQSYKEYNAQHIEVNLHMKNNNNKDDNTSCACIVF